MSKMRVEMPAVVALTPGPGPKPARPGGAAARGTGRAAGPGQVRGRGAVGRRTGARRQGARSRQRRRRVAAGGRPSRRGREAGRREPGAHGDEGCRRPAPTLQPVQHGGGRVAAAEGRAQLRAFGRRGHGPQRVHLPPPDPHLAVGRAGLARGEIGGGRDGTERATSTPSSFSPPAATLGSASSRRTRTRPWRATVSARLRSKGLSREPVPRACPESLSREPSGSAAGPRS